MNSIEYDPWDDVNLSPSEIKKAYDKNPKKDVWDELEVEETWGKNLLRTLYQIPSGIAQATTYPLDLMQMLGVGSALDEEEIEQLQRISNREGIPFDREKYISSIQQASEMFPTQGNIERLIEEKTGAPLTPKTNLQKAIKLGSTAGKFSPGTFTQKGIAAVTTPITSQALQQAGVPEPISDIAGFTVGGMAAVKSPKIDISKSKKPSGLTNLRYEKLQEPKQVSSSKISKINSKVENEFKDIASSIIEKSPIEETYSSLKNDISFKQQAKSAFKDVESLAEEIPSQFSTNIVKKELVKNLYEKKQKGFTPSEYDKGYSKFIKNFIKETPSKDISAKDLVSQYRKNNEALAQAYEPGQSFAYNRAKREALTDYNKTISDLIKNEFPDSEFSNLFESTNKKWTQIMDAEAIDKFTDKLFDGKIKYDKGHQFFDKEGMTIPFKRALGKEGFKDFEQLMKDLMSTENAHKMMKVAKSKGFKDLGETAFAFVLHPKLGSAKVGWEASKKIWKSLTEAMLDKPQLIATWDKGVKAFSKGDFATAEKAFNTLKENTSK